MHGSTTLFRSLALAAVLAPIAAHAAPAAPAPAVDKRPRVAAIVLGSDPAAVGELQRELDDRIAQLPSAHALNAAAIAEVLAIPAPPAKPRDPEAAKKAATLFDQATAAYYRDRAAQALELLDQVGKLQDADAQTPPSDRVRFQLWRVAVYLALGDKPQADAAAIQALALDPRIEIDTAEFPPSMQDAITDLRARRGRPVTILVSGLPAGAKLLLDGRPATERNDAFAGRHRLEASAPGRRDLLRTIDAQSDAAVRMPMPLLLDTSLEAQVTGILARGMTSPADAPVVAAIGKRVGAEWIVLGGVARAARIVVVKVDGAKSFTSQTVPPNAALTLVPFATETLAKQLPPPPSTGGRFGGGIGTGPAPTLPGGWAMELRGGALAANRSHNVTGTGGKPLSAAFMGVGPSLSLDVSRGIFLGSIDASYLDYGVSYLDVTLPDGSKGKVHGGSVAAGTLGAGARIPIGPADPDGSWISFLAAFGFEQLTAEDVSATGGTKLGAFANVTRTAVDVRAQGRFAVSGGTQPVGMLVGVSVSPYSSWTESPTGTTGKTPAPAISFGWNLGVEWAPARTLALRLAYRGEQRGVKFTGSAGGNAFAGLTDARETDLVNSVGLSAGYRF